MQHSIAARHAAWPARFAHPLARARERRMGLRPDPAFTAAPSRRTVLRQADPGPYTALRAPWQSMTVAPHRELSSGRPRPATAIRWSRSNRDGRPRRPSVAPAWPA